MASVILRETLNKLSFLKLSAIVSCDIGQITIDINQNGEFIIDGLLDCNGRSKPYKLYKTSEIEQLVGYIGNITEIMTLNHDTDEESVFFQKHIK